MASLGRTRLTRQRIFAAGVPEAAEADRKYGGEVRRLSRDSKLLGKSMAELPGAEVMEGLGATS
jgi:hypothetical protein